MVAKKLVLDRPEYTEEDISDVQHISPQEGTLLLDRQARKYLNMSGEEFKRKFRSGELDTKDSRVIRLSFVLPLAED